MAEGDIFGGGDPPTLPSCKRRARPLDLHALLTEPLAALHRLKGSGAEQAPQLVDVLCAAGLRATHQQSPPGVAVYVQPACSSILEELPSEEALLWLMCGLAPGQCELELEFASTVRVPLLALKLAQRGHAHGLSCSRFDPQTSPVCA